MWMKASMLFDPYKSIDCPFDFRRGGLDSSECITTCNKISQGLEPDHWPHWQALHTRLEEFFGLNWIVVPLDPEVPCSINYANTVIQCTNYAVLTLLVVQIHHCNYIANCFQFSLFN